MPPHRLIGTPVSLYTGKVRAYLRFKRIPFDEILSSKNVYRQVILPRTGVRYVPVLISDDDVAVQDTTDIIDYLEARYPEPSIYPDTPVQRLVALLLEVYGDEWLVIPAMLYRWNFEENREFAIAEFGKTIAPDASPEEQMAVGRKGAEPFAGALPALGITAQSAPALEKSYLSFLTELDHHFENHPYVLGTRPCIGDYGLLGPLYAHLYRDPYSGRLMRERAPNVATWVERMNAPGGEGGAFLPDDSVPETLFPILRRMFLEQVPVLMSTINRLHAWAKTHDGGELPRTIGSHEFCVEGVRELRRIYPYHLWMWQRPYDHFHGLGGSAKAGAASLLSALPDGLNALSRPIPRRVRRQDNRVVLD